MSISVNGYLVSDETGATLSFEPPAGALPDVLENALGWAVDFTARAINAGHETIASVLDFCGFKADQTPTGPQVDTRLKRSRALNQHDNQTGQPISGPTTGLASRHLALLRTKGPKAGLDSTEIADFGRDYRRAKDQAQMSIFISNIERALVDVGLLTLEDIRGRRGNTNGPADAQPDDNATPPADVKTDTKAPAKANGKGQDKVTVPAKPGSTTEWGEE
jgi:hypothetical protein